jgi:hypothetical protein
MRQTPSKDRIVGEAVFWVRLLVVVLVLLIVVKFAGSGSDQATNDYFQWAKDAGYSAAFSR